MRCPYLTSLIGYSRHILRHVMHLSVVHHRYTPLSSQRYAPCGIKPAMQPTTWLPILLVMLERALCHFHYCIFCHFLPPPTNDAADTLHFILPSPFSSLLSNRWHGFVDLDRDPSLPMDTCLSRRIELATNCYAMR